VRSINPSLSFKGTHRHRQCFFFFFFFPSILPIYIDTTSCSLNSLHHSFPRSIDNTMYILDVFDLCYTSLLLTPTALHPNVHPLCPLLLLFPYPCQLSNSLCIHSHLVPFLLYHHMTHYYDAMYE
jgi:hypothetical protein